MIMMVMIFDQNLLQKIITYHNDHENPCAHFYNAKNLLIHGPENTDSYDGHDFL